MISILTLEKRKNAFRELGQYLADPDEQLNQLINSAHHHNPWFTPQETHRAVKALAQMLNKEDIDHWLGYVQPITEIKKIGLVLAGNIPLVGLHDILCVLATGNHALIKLSSQDKKLIPHLLNMLTEFEPAFASHFSYTEKLEAFDAVIATGSNNTARYFEYYFGKVPHIIRKNRNSVAVLSGKESPEQLAALGDDIFSYFGLGCRNVSKLFVPVQYSFTPLFQAIERFNTVGNHYKYINNYDYNKSIFLVNGNKHLDNGFLLIKQDEKTASPLATVYYEEYETLEELNTKLNALSNELQCVVSMLPLQVKECLVDFGQSQHPKLWDYADGINTIKFLQDL
ncbi:acyl-CoA reductase [Rubrolithibacter danxiaensis]|uniref:acyl-CoA reductase n=1 Tax=Rubrolithibacter danxiaensis TaxID=3390805 RepID=UPI003BF81688